MSDRSLREITGCCEKCGTTLRRGRAREVHGGVTPLAERGEPWCPRCDFADWLTVGSATNDSGLFRIPRNLVLSGGTLNVDDAATLGVVSGITAAPPFVATSALTFSCPNTISFGSSTSSTNTTTGGR